MECLATHPWHIVLFVTTNTNLRMALLDLFCNSHQIWSHCLGALRLGWIGSQCIDCVPCFVSRNHAPTKGMGGNISMACFSSCNNIHGPDDGMVVLQFSSNLVPQLGCLWVWMDSTPVYWLCPRLSGSCTWPIHHMECLATHPWHVALHLTIYSITRMACGGFAYAVKSGPITCVLCGLNEPDHIILIMSQACKTLMMHS